VGPVESSHWKRDVSHIVGCRLWEVSSNGRDAHPLFPGWQDAQCCGTWTADGRYFVFEAISKGETNVWALREKFGLFQRTSHEPMQLTTGPMETYGPAPSLDGRRVFVGGRQLRIEILRYDLRLKAFVPFPVGNSAEGLDFSRDRKWVAYELCLSSSAIRCESFRPLVSRGWGPGQGVGD
jgi:hypothetical protein